MGKSPFWAQLITQRWCYVAKLGDERELFSWAYKEHGEACIRRLPIDLQDARLYKQFFLSFTNCHLGPIRNGHFALEWSKKNK